MTSGCNDKLHKDYGFQNVNHQYSWGMVHMSLLGKDQIISKNLSIRENPYTFLVWMSLNDLKGDCYVELDLLQLINTNNGKVVFSASHLKEYFQAGYKGNYEATFSFNKLNLNYDNYIANIDFSIKGNCISSQRESTKLLINKDYKEEKISFWDVLMGI